jgi:hypothetical protein
MSQSMQNKPKPPPVGNPYNPMTYRLIDIQTMILYQPNLVSKIVKVILA